MAKPLYKARGGVCSRGWMFMGKHGGPCDKKCQMCYYAHQKGLQFYSYETLVQHANLFRHYYGLDAVDISGGEATIFRTKSGDIVDLIGHCAAIGLKPTVITHGQNNRDDFKLGYDNPLYVEMEAAGLEDWLISLHGGTPKSHDAILCEEGAFDRLIGGLDNVKRPVRFNTTIQDTNYRDLPVNILKDRPPTVWNPIMFNPFHVWANEKAEEIDFQVDYTTAAPYLARAIEELEACGWEVNVRYWPFCIAKEHGFEANVSGYHQVPFDPWEWRLNVTQRNGMDTIVNEGGWYKSERLRAKQWMKSRDNFVCDGCSHRPICDAPPEQYQKKYGLGEITKLEGEEITDPLYYQKMRTVR